MSDPVRVLFWGSAQNGPCAYYRGHIFDAPWKELGVEVRHISSLDQTPRFVDNEGNVLPGDMTIGPEFDKKYRNGKYKYDLLVDTEPLNWCDVIVFRRYYQTGFTCDHCHFRTHAEPEARAHHALIGHGIKMHEGTMQPARDTLTRHVWDLAEKQTEKGILYETDDWFFGPDQRWNGYWPDIAAGAPLVRRMAQRADLLTVSTPTLAKHMTSLNERTVVIRNAIDPSLYKTDTQRPDDQLVRALYYGNAARLRDYSGYPTQADPRKWDGGEPEHAILDHKGKIRTVFVGAQDDQFRKGIEDHFDELHPYVDDITKFGKGLADAHGDFGLAPVLGNEFDRCKSELHWLEYAAAGVPTIATRFSGGPDSGPYNVIRHGVDGLLARGRQEWSDAVKAMLDPSRRADIAAAALERVTTEYHFEARAKEWAEAFRFASENRGIGATGGK